jgi:hypothetical protein
VVIAAAGDICKPDGNNCMKTADLIAQDPSIDAVLTMGDNQYENGELSNFQSAFDPAWGRFKNILHPAPGNHDPYNSGYKDYFNVPQRYSFDLGNWHLVSLDSNEVSGSASFLASDLAKDNHSCEIVYWHHARFSSGDKHGNDQSVAPLWDIMYQNGVDVNLVGHDHLYERFEPQSPDAKPDPAGVQQFIAGTGGDDLRGVASPQPNSTKREANVYGILKMKLGAQDYSWEYVAVGGQVLDKGSGTCHGAAGP